MRRRVATIFCLVARWFVVAACGAVSQVAAAADAEWVLREHVTVGTDAVRLVDVLETLPGNPGLPPRALTATLWRAPRPCAMVRMRRSDVETRIRSLSPAAFGATTVSGATQIEIEGACQRIEGSGVESIARQALGEWLASRSDRFDLVARQVPAAVELPPGTVVLSVRTFAAEQHPASRMLVWVDAAVAGRFVRSISVVFDVHAFRGAWLATGDVQPGIDLSDAALTLQEIDVAAQPSDALRRVPNNARLRKTLLRGDALTASHVEIRPAVTRGTSVLVRSQVGAIAIEARGEALQDARAGHPVWIRVSASTGPVLARVVGDGVVELSRE